MGVDSTKHPFAPGLPPERFACEQVQWHLPPEASQGQMDAVLSLLPYKCHLKEVASAGD